MKLKSSIYTAITIIIIAFFLYMAFTIKAIGIAVITVLFGVVFISIAVTLWLTIYHIWEAVFDDNELN